MASMDAFTVGCHAREGKHHLGSTLCWPIKASRWPIVQIVSEGQISAVQQKKSSLIQRSCSDAEGSYLDTYSATYPPTQPERLRWRESQSCRSKLEETTPQTPNSACPGRSNIPSLNKQSQGGSKKSGNMTPDHSRSIRNNRSFVHSTRHAMPPPSTP